MVQLYIAQFPRVGGFLQFALFLNSNFKARSSDKTQGDYSNCFVPIKVCYIVEHVVDFREGSM